MCTYIWYYVYMCISWYYGTSLYHVVLGYIILYDTNTCKQEISHGMSPGLKDPDLMSASGSGSSWFVQDWTNCSCVLFLISCHELRETLQIGVCHWRWDNLVVAELCGLIKRGLQLVWGRKAFAFRFGRWLCVPETWDSWQLILVFCPN